MIYYKILGRIKEKNKSDRPNAVKNANPIMKMLGIDIE